MTVAGRRRAVIVAGHDGDAATATAHLADPDPTVRAAALGAAARCDALTDAAIVDAFDDPEPEVRRRAAELAGQRPSIPLLRVLSDPDATVVEIAAWACGEQQQVGDEVLGRLIELTTAAGDALVREACAAALGAIGDARGLAAILAACEDKPQVRRRAVLALAPFDGDRVTAAIERALTDRDWQVRQAAEDLLRASGERDDS
jgi:HEAT repeat protein